MSIYDNFSNDDILIKNFNYFIFKIYIIRYDI